MAKHLRRRAIAIATITVLGVTLSPPAAPATAPDSSPTVTGPIPGSVPGDRLAERVEDTYPFFSTTDDLAGRGYVEEEFYLSGTADGWDTAGVQVADDIPYTTRLIVRRPKHANRFSGTVFAQAARTLTRTGAGSPLGPLRAQRLLAVGASQSAGRMTTYYDRILPQVSPVFDGYAFIVGSAPTRAGAEPVFQVLSETDVRTPVRPPDTDQFRRWEVAGGAHSGWYGYEYRIAISEREFGQAPVYNCDHPPFSRVPVHHVTAAAYHHLDRWVRRGTPPPAADPLLFNADGTKQRNELGLALGGIRLSQVDVPIALNTGDNTGPTFCFLFGTHRPFDEATLDGLYRSHGHYLHQVVTTDVRNVRDGYLLLPDALENLRDAVNSPVGR